MQTLETKSGGSEKRAALTITEYPIHPLCALFPDLPPNELEELAESIKHDGQQEPAVVHEGKIVDGKNRQAACKLAGETLRVKILEPSVDPVKLVVQRNLLRRNLTTSQRAAIGVEIKALYSKDAEQRMTAGKAPDPSANLRQGKASEQAAQLVKVSSRSVEAAEKVKRESPVLFKKVANGEMTVSEAVHSLPRSANSDASPALQKHFNAESRWADVKTYLKHERKVWPAEKLDYLADQLRELLGEWKEEFWQAEEDRVEKRAVKDIRLAVVGSYVRKDDLESYYGFQSDYGRGDPHIKFLMERSYLKEGDGYYEVTNLLPSKEEFVRICEGPVKDIRLAVVGSIVEGNRLMDYYGYGAADRKYDVQVFFLKELPCLEQFENHDYSKKWGCHGCFKVKGPLPSKDAFGSACEAWLKKHDEEEAAERARHDAAHLARVAEQDRKEKEALAAETPGTPMHNRRLAVEEAKAKLAEAKAKYQAIYAEELRQQEAEESNPAPKSKAQAKREAKARCEIRHKAQKDLCKAQQTLEDARNAVEAFEVSEVAKSCKKGKDLPMAQVGETVVIQDIKKFYKDHCLLVLEGYLADKEGNTEGLEDINEAESADYSLLKVLKSLPTLAEFKNLKTQTFTEPLSSVVHRAYEMIEDQKSEWQCTQDEASDAAQEGDAYAERQEKIDALEEVSEPDVPESMDAITIFCEPLREGLAAAERILERCLQAINEDGGHHSTTAEAEALTEHISGTIGTLDNL